MKKRRHDIPWCRKEITLACIVLYAITLVCAYYWATDAEMPLKLQAILIALGIAAPTGILLNLKSVLKNAGDSAVPPRE